MWSVALCAVSWAGDLPSPGPWQVVSDQAGVLTMSREMPGSPLLAFRGERVVDVDIDRLVSVVLDTDKDLDWVDMIQRSEIVAGQRGPLLYQRYDLPWPMSDRDYLTDRQFHYDDENKVLTVTFESVEDPVRPVDECCVRAMAYRTYWRFEQVDADTTKAEVEVFTDPMGSLPTWFVNFVTKSWPRNSINGLIARSQWDDVVPDSHTAQW